MLYRPDCFLFLARLSYFLFESVAKSSSMVVGMIAWKLWSFITDVVREVSFIRLSFIILIILKSLVL